MNLIILHIILIKIGSTQDLDITFGNQSLCSENLAIEKA